MIMSYLNMHSPEKRTKKPFIPQQERLKGLQDDSLVKRAPVVSREFKAMIMGPAHDPVAQAADMRERDEQTADNLRDFIAERGAAIMYQIHKAAQRDAAELA